MKEPKDKRTKEYKQWLKSQEVIIEENVGLGDVVEKITKTLGIKKCAPCEERRKRWNAEYNLFKKHTAARCLTDQQLEDYKDYKETTKLNSWQPKEVKLLINLYAHAFAIQYQQRDICVNCKSGGNTMKHIESQLDKLVEKQQD